MLLKCLLKISEMEASAYRLNQHELMVPQIMLVHREEGVFPAVYPCPGFMNAAGVMQDFETLLSNAGLTHFAEDEPSQYAKLAMSVVQDFCFDGPSPNPMVHYRIYNKPISLPFGIFCEVIRVEQWGTCEKIKGYPRPLTDLYAEISDGRSFTKENGKICNIHLPSIRYFSLFISKCVLARKVASKLSAHDLAFLAAALRKDRT